MLFRPLRCRRGSFGGGSETARVHFIDWRRGSGMAASGACATGGHTAIGFLDNASIPAQYAAGFIQGLKETGYVEGQNVVIERRSAEVNTIGCPRSQLI